MGKFIITAFVIGFIIGFVIGISSTGIDPDLIGRGVQG
tara:strand:- start:1173 stop:1286 length:114 start_codon:yes stop_codon:yes gene_type:complete